MVDNFEQQILFTDILPTVSEISARKKKLEANLPPGLPAYRVIRKERRRRSVSAYRQGGVIEIHIPAKMSRRQEIEIIPEMISMVLRREARERKTDLQLMQIGIELLTQYLPEFDTHPASINWRNMNERWGSCTTVDKTIRISDRLVGSPSYVLNYIIFHELIHLQVPNHDSDFYNYLGRYTEAAKAEAFLEGFELGCQSSGSGVIPAVNI
jgi:predicted metal-dependent hydrolase